jgi:Protein of unknown function (DUF2911)
MRSRFALWSALSALLVCPLFAASPESSTSCAFDDGKQFSIRYIPVPKDKHPKQRAVWSPGDKPIALLTETALTINNATLNPGAYTLYIIPGESSWTLVINKNVTDGAKYDKSQDVTRVDMPAGELGSSVDLKLTLAKMGPQQCNLRVYFGKTGTYGAEFKENSAAAGSTGAAAQ